MKMSEFIFETKFFFKESKPFVSPVGLIETVMYYLYFPIAYVKYMRLVNKNYKEMKKND